MAAVESFTSSIAVSEAMLTRRFPGKYNTYRASSTELSRSVCSSGGVGSPRKLISSMRASAESPPSPKRASPGRAFFANPASSVVTGPALDDHLSGTKGTLAHFIEPTISSLFHDLVALLLASDSALPMASQQRVESSQICYNVTSESSRSPSTFAADASASSATTARVSSPRRQVATPEQQRKNYNRLAYRLSRALKNKNAQCSGLHDILRLRTSAIHERAKALQVLLRHTEAVEDFTDLLANAPCTTSAFFRRGLSLRALRCYSFAADDLETARATLPRDERFNINYLVLNDTTFPSHVGEEPPSAILGLDGDADVGITRLYIGGS